MNDDDGTSTGNGPDTNNVRGDISISKRTFETINNGNEEPSVSGTINKSNDNEDRREPIGTTNTGRSVEAQNRIEEIYELFNSTEREIFDTFVSRYNIESKSSTGYYLSDIIQCSDDESAFTYADKLKSKFGNFRRSFFIISVHGSHIHVLHDCPYSDKSCRCQWLKETKTDSNVDVRRSLFRRKRGIPIRGLKNTDWENIFLYFSTHGREIIATSLSGQLEKIQIDFKDLSHRRYSRCKLQGQIESCFQNDPDELQRELCFPEINREIGGGDSQVLKKQKTTRSNVRQELFSATLRFLEENPICPIANIVDHPKWLEDKFLCKHRSNNILVQNAIDVFCKRTMTWNIDDYYKLYSNPKCIPIFSAGWGNINEIYYDLEDSVTIMSDLLQFQCYYDEEQVIKLLNDLYELLERKIPKYNCLVINSPPSSGKNFFFDAVCDFFLNRGSLERLNKHNQFGFQEAFGKRVLMWDEPNYEQAVIESLKKLMAGTACTVRVKCKPDAAVYRTPLIVMTNTVQSFMVSPAFADRIRIYRWRVAPQLKAMTKLPLPLATYYLFLKYGIIKDSNYYCFIFIKVNYYTKFQTVLDY
jgi:hypothetical protein